MVFHELFIASWWVWAAFILCFGLYEQGIYLIAKEKKQLKTELVSTKQKCMASKALQQEQQKQLTSLSNPFLSDSVWIERELIQNLGLVPESYTKIVLKKADNS